MVKNISRPPLIYMLSQVAFSPSIDIQAYVEHIKSALKNDFPDCVQQKVVSVNIQTGQNVSADTQKQEVTTWIFKDVIGTSSLVFGPSSIAFQSTAHTSFDDSLNKLLLGLQVFPQLASPAVILRTGLRYVNVIGTNEQNAHTRVDSRLLGLIPNDADYLQTTSQSILKFKDGAQLNLNAARTPQHPALMIDLSGADLQLQDLESETMITLDFDCYSTERSAFNSKFIEEKLKILHSHIKNIFNISCKDSF